MAVNENDLYKRRGWPAGINNIAAETALPTGSDSRRPAALRDAVNVDINNDGKPQRRDGYEMVLGGDTHSAWSDAGLPFGLFVRNETLVAMDPGEIFTDIVSPVSQALPMSYALFGDLAFYSNGVQSGLVTSDKEHFEWGASAPAGSPLLQPIAGGLDPGEYLVTCTFVDALGRESGAPTGSAISLPNGGGIGLSEIPQPPGGGHIRVYMNDGHGGALKFAQRLVPGTTSWDLTQRPNGRLLETQHLDVMPAGQIVRLFNGRQLVARGDELLFSPTLRYGQWEGANARIRFAGQITLMEPIGDGTGQAGVFVADQRKTYFLSGGNPKDWAQSVALPKGSVPGTSVRVPSDSWGLDNTDPTVTWMTADGDLAVGLPGGQVRLVTPQNTSFDVGDSGASMYREFDGIKQVVTSLRGSRPGALAVRDNMIVKDYKHGPDQHNP